MSEGQEIMGQEPTLKGDDTSVIEALEEGSPDQIDVDFEPELTSNAAKYFLGKYISYIFVIFTSVCVVVLLLLCVPRVMRLNTRVDDLYKNLNGLASRVGDLGKLTAGTSDTVGELCSRINDLEASQAKLSEMAFGLQGKVDRNDAAVANLNEQASLAAKAAAKTREIAARRVKAENQKYREMLAYIRNAYPEAELAKLTNKQIAALLSNGVWDVEPKIEAEYNRLIANTAKSAQRVANRAAIELLAVENKVAKATAAGETALSALEKIADQPVKPLGRSVSQKTKAAIKNDLDEYWQEHDAVIKAGAPEK